MDTNKGLKLLLVDDDESSKLLLTMMMQPVGREILIASDGCEAVNTCKNHPDIDLIMMDIKMPVMNGLEATKQIRLFNKKVIIIAQSAFDLANEHEDALNAGCNAFIAKPINRPTLLVAIEKLFNKV
jgi:CheY-like chemotaxis protein